MYMKQKGERSNKGAITMPMPTYQNLDFTICGQLSDGEIDAGKD